MTKTAISLATAVNLNNATMKKYILICAVTFVTVACTSKNKTPVERDGKKEPAEKTFIDTLDMLYSDTLNLSTSPLLIINTEIHEKNSVLKTPITFTVKNIGSKSIEAVKFRMIVRDAFGEIVYELSGTSLQYGEARMDELIKVGQTQKHTELFFFVGEPKKVAKCFPYEIAFSDGKIWNAAFPE